MKEMVGIWTPITPDNVNLVLALETFFWGGGKCDLGVEECVYRDDDLKNIYTFLRISLATEVHAILGRRDRNILHPAC